MLGSELVYWTEDCDSTVNAFVEIAQRLNDENEANAIPEAWMPRDESRTDI